MGCWSGVGGPGGDVGGTIARGKLVFFLLAGGGRTLGLRGGVALMWSGEAVPGNVVADDSKMPPFSMISFAPS